MANDIVFSVAFMAITVGPIFFGPGLYRKLQRRNARRRASRNS